MAFLTVLVTEKHIQLVREKFITFSFGQYINGIVVYCSVLKCSVLRDRCWHFEEICKNVTGVFCKLSTNIAISISKLFLAPAGLTFYEYA